ncbi:MAG: hypothetical protein REI12_14715, partial [Pedobacter sp.]|nr:hypothetical protein [Pedobacter sp.]
DFDGVRLWAIGQAVAVQSLLDTLTDPARGRDGLFPELVLFDCHACHHPMSDKRWQPRQGVGPGRIRLNDSNLIMLRNIVKVVSPSDSVAFNAQILKVHRAIAGESVDDPLAEARKLSKLVDRQISFFAKRRFSTDDIRALLRNLIDEGVSDGYTDYAGAEQAYMAISSVGSYLQKSGGLSVESSRQLNLRLTAMQKILGNDENYVPATFRNELLKLRTLVGSTADSKAGNSNPTPRA